MNILCMILCFPLSRREAHVDNGPYLQYVIAKEFTERDGSTRLYLGQEQVLPGLLGWLLPHDAPYKAKLDRWIMACVEVRERVMNFC